MANADGSVIIKADIDDKQAQKELDALTKKIDALQEKLNRKKAKRDSFATDFNDIGAQLDAAKAKLDQMKNSGEFFTNSSIKQQEETVASIQRRFDEMDKKLKSQDESIKDSTEKLDEMKAKAGELGKQLGSTGKNAKKIKEGIDKASQSMESFNKRLKVLAKQALVFTVIAQALSKLREWISDVVMANSEARDAIAQLKGALLTLAQPLVQIVIPAFTTLVKVLTAVVSAIANVVSSLFGSTAKESAGAAKSLNEQKNAYKGVGSAAKEASKQLAAFDEINKLSAEESNGSASSSAGIAPDFSFMDSISPRLEQIGKDVALIGAGFALWKISESLPGILGTIGTKLGGILIAIGGIMLAVDGLKDAWENGVDWGNMAEIIGGVAAAALGLYKVFGKIGAGIALIVGGAAMIVTAFNDIIDNGANLQNTLLLIAGIVATGLGFFFLTGSVIPLVIAGVAAIVIAILGLTGNLEEFCQNFKENILGGLIDFIAGVFTGDWERAWDGVKSIFKGVFNGIVMILESAVNLIIKGLNWLINKINTIQINIPDWLGGGSLGFNIPQIGELQIPRLAQGAVIPPNREFLAVLGDQKSGTNIEAPADLIRQIVREELNSSSGGEEITIKFTGDLAQLARVLSPEITRQQRRNQRAMGV